MSFTSFNLNPLLLQSLADKGYQQATPVQLQAIPLVMQQQDVIARAQTGTGKTAAFALPMLDSLLNQPIQPPVLRALVLTPTRELAQQVQQSFVAYAKHTTLVSTIAYGGVSLNPQITALKAGADILVATPGRLLDLMEKGVVVLDKLAFLVLDEADRMLDMGFINDIKRIIRKVPVQRQTLLFSATFDNNLLDLSKMLLNDPKSVEIDAQNTAASQVEQIIYNVDADRKRELISYLIGSKNWQQVLIFTRTKIAADALAKEMCKDGVKTQSIHGDKSQGAREKALADFKSGQVRALVATDVAARGLDISDLKYVINYELPYIAEDYIHRIGRTGRAGSSGTAISLLSVGEEWLLEEIETLLNERLPQQWLAGYEPDLTKAVKGKKIDSKSALKSKMKKQLGLKSTSSKSKQRKRR
ncbi:DEAD/DEAH box helicase [Alteromonadaceae bacterium BrNp21-10]|nr:DEAD/DEAH box helicase [Alteromonadaceae bacterium BrNp21-10]